ncbi:unnamed protein product [Bursaphelenchus xylophilus]|uniref:(pine wood nematode) hypothetical protein n=1 Tax=Bursaphelenchus xylophilus TaxID=6326 RepID=A0A7I8WRL8_BURXY|nr:unnamed protein product [Bursaphelenchus xylophilus]CAG9114437.1 unnamed protein product [Bursaphelenchus xylophilus]
MKRDVVDDQDRAEILFTLNAMEGEDETLYKTEPYLDNEFDELFERVSADKDICITFTSQDCETFPDPNKKE